MLRMMFFIHLMAATVLMGIGVTAVLAANLPGWRPVVGAAAIGFVLSIPLSYAVARKLVGTEA